MKKFILFFLFACSFVAASAQWVNQDSIRVWKEKAEQGDAEAQCDLGYMYENGYGVLQSSATAAVKWYRKAAEQGNAIAQYNLGRCYRNGYGVAKNMVEAKKWYQKAAAQGDEEAKKVLRIYF